MGFWGTIWAFLQSLKCWEILNPNEAGVHLRFGNVLRTVEEGLHWKLPGIDEIQSVSTARQSIDLPNQTLTTKDLHTVNISGTIRYEIVAPEKLIFAVDDFDEELMTLAMEVIGEEVASRDWGKSLVWLKKKVLRVLEVEAAKIGINIIRLGISDYARARAWRLYN